ncbi:MAG: hypothetical protein VX451_02595, partial [Candidatus Thermoplasmatota archaeon]|nr:hypothetical protein [Candidatus Thermoplasmatota archaeon]
MSIPAGQEDLPDFVLKFEVASPLHGGIVGEPKGRGRPHVFVPLLNRTGEHFTVGVLLAPVEEPVRLRLHGFIALGLTAKEFGLQSGDYHPVGRQGVGDVGISLHVNAAPFRPQRKHLVVEITDGEHAQHDREEDGQQAEIG